MALCRVQIAGTFVHFGSFQVALLDADHASNETGPAHRLATFQSQTRVSDNWH